MTKPIPLAEQALIAARGLASDDETQLVRAIALAREFLRDFRLRIEEFREQFAEAFGGEADSRKPQEGSEASGLQTLLMEVADEEAKLANALDKLPHPATDVLSRAGIQGDLSAARAALRRSALLADALHSGFARVRGRNADRFASRSRRPAWGGLVLMAAGLLLLTGLGLLRSRAAEGFQERVVASVAHELRAAADDFVFARARLLAVKTRADSLQKRVMRDSLALSLSPSSRRRAALSELRNQLGSTPSGDEREALLRDFSAISSFLAGAQGVLMSIDSQSRTNGLDPSTIATIALRRASGLSRAEAVVEGRLSAQFFTDAQHFEWLKRAESYLSTMRERRRILLVAAVAFVEPVKVESIAARDSSATGIAQARFHRSDSLTRYAESVVESPRFLTVEPRPGLVERWMRGQDGWEFTLRVVYAIGYVLVGTGAIVLLGLLFSLVKTNVFDKLIEDVVTSRPASLGLISLPVLAPLGLTAALAGGYLAAPSAHAVEARHSSAYFETRTNAAFTDAQKAQLDSALAGVQRQLAAIDTITRSIDRRAR